EDRMSLLHVLVEAHTGFLLIDWNLFRNPSRTRAGVRSPMFLLKLGCRDTVSRIPRKLCRCQKFQRSRHFCVLCSWLIGLLVPRLFEVIAGLICRGDGRSFVRWDAQVNS